MKFWILKGFTHHRLEALRRPRPPVPFPKRRNGRARRNERQRTERRVMMRMTGFLEWRKVGVGWGRTGNWFGWYLVKIPAPSTSNFHRNIPRNHASLIKTAILGISWDCVPTDRVTWSTSLQQTNQPKLVPNYPLVMHVDEWFSQEPTSAFPIQTQLLVMFGHQPTSPVSQTARLPSPCSYCCLRIRGHRVPSSFHVLPCSYL